MMVLSKNEQTTNLKVTKTATTFQNNQR